MNSRDRRTFGHGRLLSFFNLPRTLAALGMLFSVGMATLVYLRTRPLDLWPLSVAALIGVLAWWTLRDRWTWGTAAMMILTGLMAWLTLGQQIPRRGLWGGVQYLWATNLLLACAMAVVAILSGLRLLAPLKALLLSASVALGLLTCELALDRLQPRRRAETPGAPMNQELSFVWQGVASVPDQELTWVYRPHGAMKTVYPLNPRDYFEVESRLGSLDMRIWQLHAAKNVQAAMVASTERDGPVRVQVKKVATGQSWELSLFQAGLPIEAGQTYELQLRAKADRQRGAQVSMVSSTVPIENCGLALPLFLSGEWQDIEVSFEATRSDDLARLELQLGTELGDLEVASVQITPRPSATGAYGALDHSRWSTSVAAGRVASLKQVDGGASRAELVKGQATEPWEFIVACPQLPLRGGKQYLLTGQVRADDSRVIGVAVNQAHKPWDNLGLVQNVTVDQQWHDVQFVFKPPADERNARVELQLGDSPLPVEFRNFRLAIDGPTAQASPAPPVCALRQMPGCRAEISSEAVVDAPTRLAIHALPEPDPAAVQVEWTGDGVRSGDRVTLTFRAQADAPRTLAVSVREGRPPWRTLMPTETVDVTSDWNTFDYEFAAPLTDDSPRIVFEAGSSDVACTFANVQLIDPLSSVQGRMLPNDAWKMASEGGVWAKQTLTDDALPAVHCRQNAGKKSVPWAALTSAPVGTLKAGGRYLFSAEMRAQRPRRLTLAIGPEGDQWTNLQAYQARALTADWQRVSFDFSIQEALPQAQAALLLGAADGWIEFRDARLYQTSGDQLRHALQYTVAYVMNEHGYRDRPRARECPPNVFRIACLGDSFTFGQGVHAPDVFTQRLERQLNAARGPNDPTYEVLNFGVCGYDTAQERKVYERIAATFRPQAVLLFMVDNDDVNYSQERDALEDASRTQGLRAVDLIRQRATARPASFLECVDEIEKLRRVCQSHGARLGVCVFRNFVAERWSVLVDQVSAGLKGTDVPFIDLGEAILDGHTPDEMMVLQHEGRPIDGHPNELAHEIVARQLDQFLTEHRFLPSQTTGAPQEPEPAADNSEKP